MAGQIDAKKRRLDQVSASRADTIQQKLQHSAAPTFKVPSLLVTNHTFRVPLDHTGEVEGDIELFVRELVSSDKTGAALPYLLFLQGGPGFECARPTDASTWVKTALTSFRVLLLDQRGTGRSQAITTANLQKRGGPAEQARYLAFFRADSIVRDCEAVRKCMVPADSTGSQWSILGQSFGGFCALTYLSLAPQGLKEVMMAGGIPPGITEPCAADTVYQALFPRVIAQNKKYYGRYPGDVAHVQRIVRCLAAQPGGGARLPSGSLLSPRGLQLLGLSGLGMTGGFDRLHYLLEDFFDSDGDINPSFLKAFESWMPYDTNPLYALVHESIYCQGAASNWRAQAVRDAHFSAQFDAIQCAADDQPVFFTGEVVFPWMFDDFVALRPFKAAADLLAAKADWPSLYDVNVLEANTVPVATATYFEDLYVDFNLCQATAEHVAGIRQWVTNEYKHSGIRDDGPRIFDRLLTMARDTLPIE